MGRVTMLLFRALRCSASRGRLLAEDGFCLVSFLICAWIGRLMIMIDCGICLNFKYIYSPFLL